jgi:ADP-ribose pyrophosphatase
MAKDIERWERISSRQVADCRVFRVREELCRRASDGEQHSFYTIANPDWVNVIATTRREEIVLIEQFRQGTFAAELELPGGMIDPGEMPLEAAKRELREETGFTSGQWRLLGISHPNPALQNNSIYHYAALECELTDETAFDEHESIAVRLTPPDDAEKLILSGMIRHSLVVAAFHYLRLSNEQL